MTSEQLYKDYAEVNADNNYSREDFYTEYLGMVEENLEKPADGSMENSVVNNIGGGALSAVDLNQWYVDIPTGTAAGSKTAEVFVASTDAGDKDKYPDIYIYDGLPWPADNNTYFFNLRKAREDVWPLYEKAGVQKGYNSSMFMSSSVSHKAAPKEVTYDGQYSGKIDGVDAIGVGVWSTMWKNYYTDCALTKGTMDSSADLWKYKIAIVVVDKGKDINNQGNWKYVPATRQSAKAHTFYGGILQTNVNLTNNGDIITTSSSSGYYGNTTVGNTSDYGSGEADIVSMINDTQKLSKYSMGSWWVHYIENYNVGKERAASINNRYDFVGYVIYGGTFSKM